jgi:ApaG protein
MISTISEGIEVSVETFYQKDYSNPLQQDFMFAYRITIENHNSVDFGRYLTAMANTGW